MCESDGSLTMEPNVILMLFIISSVLTVFNQSIYLYLHAFGRKLKKYEEGQNSLIWEIAQFLELIGTLVGARIPKTQANVSDILELRGFQIHSL